MALSTQVKDGVVGILSQFLELCYLRLLLPVLACNNCPSSHEDARLTGNLPVHMIHCVPLQCNKGQPKLMGPIGALGQAMFGIGNVSNSNF